jgi:chromosome segregation ATPase
MVDIVERLRTLYATHPIIIEAADTIERLRTERLAFATESEERQAEIERLRAMIKSNRATYAGYDAESAAYKKHIDELTSALAGLAQALVRSFADTEQLRSALQEIADQRPATSVATLAHQMADTAIAALGDKLIRSEWKLMSRFMMDREQK